MCDLYEYVFRPLIRTGDRATAHIHTYMITSTNHDNIRALGSGVHRPTPDAERQISLVGLQSISAGV